MLFSIKFRLSKYLTLVNIDSAIYEGYRNKDIKEWIVSFVLLDLCLQK